MCCLLKSSKNLIQRPRGTSPVFIASLLAFTIDYGSSIRACTSRERFVLQAAYRETGESTGRVLIRTLVGFVAEACTLIPSKRHRSAPRHRLTSCRVHAPLRHCKQSRRQHQRQECI